MCIITSDIRTDVKQNAKVREPLVDLLTLFSCTHGARFSY